MKIDFQKQTHRIGTNEPIRDKQKFNFKVWWCVDQSGQGIWRDPVCQVVAIEGETKTPGGEDPFYYSSNEKLQSKKPLHHCFDENL